ncbi:hypothetical protein EVAR_43575_1 [Eumeta japonica]|uniref:Uncharacterized protein n=1 Tax=Eumeta variegata TaxID=151549 RepID=A0A4C1XDX9_EUMVA|nr:hypothetical protein EVAR_43575_1 [Eumeta japonica]
MSYECPDTDLDRLVRFANPASSRASSSATSPTSSQASSQSSTRSSFFSKGSKRYASSFSKQGTSSDSTVVGTDDNDSDSGKFTTGKTNSSQSDSFALIKGKNQKAIRKALKKSKTSDVISPSNGMDVDASRDASAPATNNVVVSSPQTNSLPATSTQAATKTPSVARAKFTAPPKSRISLSVFLRKGAKFLKISADCKRLRINYSKAIRVADDGIKILCLNVETSRSLNKYLVDNKVQFHTYALEEERKLKVVIRCILTNSHPTIFKLTTVNRGSRSSKSIGSAVVTALETLHCLLSDHRPVMLKMGPPGGGRPMPTIKITYWKRVSSSLEKIDTPPLNSIPEDIRTTDEIDFAIGAFTSHIKTVVDKCERDVPRRKFPPNILELMKAKNAALRRASAYPTPEYRFRSRALQREVKARVHEF